MEATNEIRMKILKDGTISIDTDSFEETVHQEAHELVAGTIALLGGENTVVERKEPGQHGHVHHHGHQSHSH